MTTRKQAEANKRNALRSTGPRTLDGKARSSLNALKHGLRAGDLAVHKLEDPAAWEGHRQQVLKDLSPVGYFETVLAERAASLLWRLGRVVRFEKEHISHRIQAAPEECKDWDMGVNLLELQERLACMRKQRETLSRVFRLRAAAEVSPGDADLVLDTMVDCLGVEREEDVEISEPPPGTGWTRELVEKGVQAIRAATEEDCGDPWLFAIESLAYRLEEQLDGYKKLAAKVDREERERLLPKEEVLDKLSRYESHLERSLFRTLHELQRLRAARSGHALPPPAVVDLDVNVHPEGS